METLHTVQFLEMLMNNATEDLFVVEVKKINALIDSLNTYNKLLCAFDYSDIEKLAIKFPKISIVKPFEVSFVVGDELKELLNQYTRLYKPHTAEDISNLLDIWNKK